MGADGLFADRSEGKAFDSVEIGGKRTQFDDDWRKTQKIAEDRGAKLIQFVWNGKWPKKKNWALENLPLRNGWVLILDADEELVPEAEEEIREICNTNKRGFDGYFIDRRFFFMGKWLDHCYRPNWALRIFKKGQGRYEKLMDGETASGDVEIHEQVILNGKAGKLKTMMNHYAFPTVAAFIEKHNRYSSWEARLAVEGNAVDSCGAGLGSWGCRIRRGLKNLSRRLPCRPFLRFLYVYFFHLGFLDGREGYYFARLHAFYEFLCVCKTYELKRQRSGGTGHGT
jgi:hypothetical protein